MTKFVDLVCEAGATISDSKRADYWPCPTCGDLMVYMGRIKEQLFRTLNAEFGPKGWTVNVDPRYCVQVDCHPIDILVPIGEQEAILPKVLKLQADLSRKLDIQVFFVITAPD